MILRVRDKLVNLAVMSSASYDRHEGPTPPALSLVLGGARVDFRGEDAETLWNLVLAHTGNATPPPAVPTGDELRLMRERRLDEVVAAVVPDRASVGMLADFMKDLIIGSCLDRSSEVGMAEWLDAVAAELAAAAEVLTDAADAVTRIAGELPGATHAPEAEPGPALTPAPPGAAAADPPVSGFVELIAGYAHAAAVKARATGAPFCVARATDGSHQMCSVLHASSVGLDVVLTVLPVDALPYVAGAAADYLCSLGVSESEAGRVRTDPRFRETTSQSLMF